MKKYIQLFNNYADGISILTDEKFFKGDIKFIQENRNFTSLPVLAKDFYIHPVQIRRAFHYQADAILIIAKILDERKIKLLYDTSRQLGLDAIVEVHSKEDIEKVLHTINPEIIGINTRDLNDFSIHPEIIDKLLPLIPKGIYTICESGINSPEEIRNYKDKFDAVLIGTAIMKAPNPETFLEQLLYYAE